MTLMTWKIGRGKIEWREYLKAGLAILVLCFVSLAGLELLGQLYFAGNPNYFFEHRFLYTTANSFRNVRGFWTYQPNSRIDEIAIYRTPFRNFFKEYECHYRTDRLGFLDNPESDRRTYDVLLLGDSFTAGAGGCSWVDGLRAKVPGYAIYNAALPGTGWANWAEIKSYLETQGYEFRQVILVFIAGDWSRRLKSKGERELACLRDVTRCVHEVYYPLDEKTDLFEMSARRARLRPNQLSDKLGYLWRKYFWVSEFLVSQGVPLFSQPDVRGVSVDGEATAAFDRIVSISEPTRFVRIATKDEAALRTEDAETLVVSKFFADRSLQFETCRLDMDDFLGYDGHPNRRGYDKVAACVAQVVRGLRR
jgi:hypothetical protein